MGNNESSTPKLTKNSALSSPPVTPILPLRGKNLRKTDATNDSKNEVKVFMEDGNEIVEDSFIEDKENVDGRISRERSLVGTPISMNKLKKPNIFTPQTRKDRQNRIQRKHSNLSNASVTQDTVSTPAAPYESDSDSVLKARRVPNMKEDSDASIILDSDKSDSDVTLDEEDDVIKSEDDEAESGLDDSFIVDEDTEGGNFIESTQVQDDYRSSSDESFRDNDSIMIDESIVGNVPNASRRRPKRSLPKNKAKTNPTFSTSGIGSSQDPVTILPSQDNQSIKAASGESDSDVTLDEEDDVIKSGDDEEEAQFNDSFIVDDTEGGNFIESTQFKDDGAESDSILIDESIVENFPPPPRRPKRSLPKRQAKSHLRKSNPASSTFGSGSRQDPVTILPSQDFESVKAASGESDSDATLGEEDDVMESEDEEMSDNSFIVEDEEEEEDIYLTQKPTIQSDSDESFICDESLVIDESIVERLPRTCRRKGAGAGRNQDDFEISVMEDFPCSTKRRNAKTSSALNQSCVIIEDSNDEIHVEKGSSSTKYGNKKLTPTSTNSSMPEIIELDSFINSEKRLYGGKMTDKRQDRIAAVTVEVIKQIHGSLDSMPENVVTETPEDLTVDLMLHQKHGLTWMKWRENQRLNRGGILADDMGLGKTLSMISLIVSQKNDRKNNVEVKEKLAADIKKHFSSEYNVYPAYCTLVVAPASVIYQWEKEIRDRVKSGKLKVYVFHGPKREKDPRMLARNDIVITTYNTISSELGEEKSKSDDEDSDNFIDDKWYSKKKAVNKKIIVKYNKKSVLAQIGWERIILDEAHNIKNRKSLMSKGCCQLHAFRRWALTGTPIHNELWDFYSLIKFLRISPFSDQGYWKMHMSDMSGKVARERLNTLVKSILLRRTKKQICSVTKKPLVNLKPRTFELIEIKLEGIEEKCYQQMMEASQQRVTELINQQSQSQQQNFQRIHRHRNKETTVIKNPFIAGNREIEMVGGNFQMMSCLLVLLLRLRQACVHMALTKQAVDLNAFKVDGGDDIEDENIDEFDRTFGNISLSAEAIITKENKEIDKIFEPNYASAKLKVLLQKVDHVIESGDKCVIVSQWTSMLDIVYQHLKKKKLKLTEINGKIATKDRQERIDSFNRKNGGAQIMLLSLTAGGVGLNLVGGNHLFLLDLHWNPALEQQAFDRIYRVGQTKDVFIHKLICKNTVEQRVLELQENKLQLAASVLEGATKQNNKLSVNDLKYLFGLAKER